METGLSHTGRLWSLISFAAAVVCSVGFFMPFWLEGEIHQTNGVIRTDLGVFRRCNYLMSTPDDATHHAVAVMQCGRYSTFWDIPSPWWQAATVTLGVGCGLAILVSFSALLCCCIRDSMSKNLARIAGIVQATSGLLIAAGCILYCAGWNNLDVKEACGKQVYSFNHGTCKLSWAFYTTVAGGGFIFICAFLACFAAERKGGYQRVTIRSTRQKSQKL